MPKASVAVDGVDDRAEGAGKAAGIGAGVGGHRRSIGRLAVRGSSAFGAPFTRSGWIIENSPGSFDVTFKDTGGFVARMTIFREHDLSDWFNLNMARAIKTVGIKDGSPLCFDFAIDPPHLAPRLCAARGTKVYTTISRTSGMR